MEQVALKTSIKGRGAHTTEAEVEAAFTTLADFRDGMLLVMSKGHWHRFFSDNGVTVLTATPQPTMHTFAEDPRYPNGIGLG